MIIGTQLGLIKIIVCVTASEIDELVINSNSNKTFISLIASAKAVRKRASVKLACSSCADEQQGIAETLKKRALRICITCSNRSVTLSFYLITGIQKQ